VLVVERWILARLRNLEFFSLGELNKHIATLIERLNTRDFKKIEGNRRLRFEQGEKPALKPLPAKPYEFGEWRKAKVHPDYHIEVARAYYSVPYRLIGERVDVRLTAYAVEVFHRGEKVAAHARAKSRAQRSTRRTHRPEKHIAVIDLHLDRVLERALTVGPATFGVVQAQAGTRKHPEESLRSAQGILRLAHDFTPARLEAACERALALRACSYRAVRTLIQTPMATAASPALDLAHENVRGAEYFQ
jgi:transposase